MQVLLLRAFCALLLLPVWPAAVIAESPPLEEVVISASPHRKTVEQLTGAADYLSGRQLQRERAATLGGTLQHLPGVHASSFGPGVGQPVIRGYSGKRVEILQNNTAVADVSDVSADHAVAVETLLADRIEILRGPAVLRYGTGAIGGVINVIDNRIHTEAFQGYDGDLALRYNTNNNEQVAAARLDAGWQRFILHLGATGQDSTNVQIPGRAAADADEESTSGYIRNSNSYSDSWNIALSRVSDSWVAGVSLEQSNKNYGLPPGGHGHGHEDEDEDEHEEEEEAGVRIDMEQQRSDFKLLFTDLGEVLEQLDLRLTHTDYEHLELEMDDGASTVGTLFDQRSLELRSEMTYQVIGDGRGAVGVQYSERDFRATGEEAFVPASKTDRLGIYTLKEWQPGSTTVELGARWDHQQITSQGIARLQHHSFNFSAGLLAPLTDRHRAGLVFTRSERVPVAEELLSEGVHIATGTYDIGDPGLDRESALSIEAKWTYEGAVKTQLNLYHSHFDDYIYQHDTELRFSHDLEEAGRMGLEACSGAPRRVDFSNDEEFEEAEEEYDESPECFEYRQRRARFSGLEFEAMYAIDSNHRLRLWGDYVRARFADDDVPRTPPGRVGLGWYFTHGAWAADLRLLRVFAQDRPGENQERSAGYLRIDAGLDWRTGAWHFFLHGRNLGDREIRNATSFLRRVAPEPGREIIAGATLRF